MTYHAIVLFLKDGSMPPGARWIMMRPRMGRERKANR
jgi:hypothetical protein